MIQSEPITTTITTTIIKNYSLDNLVIQMVNGELDATVQLSVKDQDGNLLDTIITNYRGEEYNTWWNNFNSWKDVLSAVITDAVVPDNIDDELKNNIE